MANLSGEISSRAAPVASTVPPTRVLVAEDDATLGELMVEGLTDLGFEVELSTSGTAALEQIRARKPDVLICDIMMPGCDGFQVLQSVRDDPRLADLVVIMLSACAEKIDVRKGMNWGADDYLTKPVHLAELARTIASRLRRAAVSRRSDLAQASLMMESMAVAGVTPEERARQREILQRLHAEWDQQLQQPDQARALSAEMSLVPGRVLALSQTEDRASDLMLSVEPGKVRCRTSDWDLLLERLLAFAFRNSPKGDPLWIVGTWEQCTYQLSLWNRECELREIEERRLAELCANPMAESAQIVGLTDLQIVAAIMKLNGGLFRFQNSNSAGGLRLHLHFQRAAASA